MAKSKQEIISDIDAHIKKGGGGYGAWYVGISEDAEKRLNKHNAKEWYIYRQASSSQVAREIEIYFVNVLGTDGGTGGGDENTDMVYAYKKTADTDP